MKTTLDLDDALLRDAKAAALRRRTTLRAVVEHALRRELMPQAELANPDPARFEMGPLGFLVLRREPGAKITLEAIEAVKSELDDAEFRRAVAPRRR